MLKHCRGMLVGILLLVVSTNALAFWDPPYITPPTPDAGQVASVNIRMGDCDALFHTPGYPQITQSGTHITVVQWGQHWEPGELCTFLTGTAALEIGAYPPGQYTVSLSMRYRDFFSDIQELHLGDAQFTVAAPTAAASPVPALGFFAIAGLILLVLAIVWRRNLHIRSSILGLIILMGAGVFPHARAGGVVAVLLSSSAGAPTPATLVSYTNALPRSPTPPLQAFNTVAPLSGNFLIPDRASGDFLAWLNSNPNSPRKKLEDYVLLTYAIADVPAAISSLTADPYVVAAYEPLPVTPSSVELQDFSVVTEEPSTESAGAQYGWFDLNVDEAWKIATGNSFVSIIDMGIYPNHPALRQFSGSLVSYDGGNFMSSVSKDVSYTGSAEPSNSHPWIVDELKPLNPPDPSCASSVPVRVGHGTHVSGLLGARAVGTQAVEGTCKHCGLAMWKVSSPQCVVGTPSLVQLSFNSLGSDRAQAQSIDIGAQINSMSFGTAATYVGITYCVGHQNYPSCLALSYMKSRDVIGVGASGNNRTDLQFPASDPRIVSAGGYQDPVAYWDESPGNNTNCPYISPNAPVGSECGSNYSKTSATNGYNHQELIASAKSVFSTTYPNYNWVTYAHCGDQYQPGGVLGWGSGVGLCTGTSMSTPQVAGVVGILRSVNPLVTTGTATSAPAGIRTVLTRTTPEAVAGAGWTTKAGYGHPDARKAAEQMLGKVDGVITRNRATPLFRLYDSSTKDFADVTSPQQAMSLLINQAHNYSQPSGTALGTEVPVPGYTFPYDAATEPARPTPRAAIYVLTTEYRPRTEWPELRPLYLMDKDYAGGKDYLIATTKGEVEAAYFGPDNIHCNNGHLENSATTCASDDYNLRTIQGYIYQPCAPEATCKPPGTRPIYREFRTTDSDCAVFLDTEKTAFENAGYTGFCPGTTTKMIGYAYPAGDDDGDGLPNALEYVIGTNPAAADSDGDGLSDSTEYPLSGVPVSDPCSGGTLGAKFCPADVIFKNGFNP